MKKHVVLFGLLAFCFTITAQEKQEKISVIKIDEGTKYEEIFQDYYEKNSKTWKNKGYNDAALFAKLFEQYVNKNKAEIDNPDVLSDKIKKLEKDVKNLANITKDNEEKKSELKKLNNDISELNGTISNLKTKIDSITKSQMSLDTLLSLHKKDSADLVKKEELLKEKENTIKDKNTKIISLENDLNTANEIVRQNNELKREINDLFNTAAADFENVYKDLGVDVFSVDEKTVKAAVEKVKSVESIWPSDYTDKINKVKKVSELAKLLKQAKDLMAGPYDENSVNSLLKNDVILNKKSWLWTSEQTNQTNDIVISLSNFSKYVSNFEKMIDLINSDLEKSGRREPKEECKRYEMTIKSTFAFVSKGDAEKDGYGKYFKNLNKQLNSLIKKVLNDVNRPNVPENDLMKLKESVRTQLK